MEPSRTASTIRLVVRDSDRRRHVRTPTLYHLVMHTEARKRIVSVENISLGGVAVYSVDPPAPNTPVQLAFPKPVAKSGEMIAVAGTIVRQAGTGVIGIMFGPGQERTVKSILKLLPAVRPASQKVRPQGSRRRPTRRRAAIGLRSSKAKRTAKRR
jgi:hypothetical protein